MSEEAILVCLPSKHLPLVPSDRGNCGDCEQEIWIDRVSVDRYKETLDLDVTKFVCLDCAAKSGGMSIAAMIAGLQASIQAGIYQDSRRTQENN